MEESTCHKMVIGQFEEICLYVCLFFERFNSFEYAFDIDGERTIIFDNKSTSPADICKFLSLELMQIKGNNSIT